MLDIELKIALDAYDYARARHSELSGACRGASGEEFLRLSALEDAALVEFDRAEGRYFKLIAQRMASRTVPRRYPFVLRARLPRR